MPDQRASDRPPPVSRWRDARLRLQKAVHRVSTFLRSFHAFDSVLVLSQIPITGDCEYGGKVYHSTLLSFGPFAFHELTSHSFADLLQSSDFVSLVQDTHVAALSRGTRNGSNALQLLASGKLALRLNRITAEHCPLSRVSIGGGDYMVYSDVLELRARALAREENKRLLSEPPPGQEGDAVGSGASAGQSVRPAPLVLPKPPLHPEKVSRVCDWIRELPEFTMRMSIDHDACSGRELPSFIRSMPATKRSMNCIYSLSKSDMDTAAGGPSLELGEDLLFAPSASTGSHNEPHGDPHFSVDAVRECSGESVSAAIHLLNCDAKAPRKLRKSEFCTALGASDLFLTGYEAGGMVARFMECLPVGGQPREPPSKQLPTDPLTHAQTGPRTLFCFTVPLCPPFARRATRPRGDTWTPDCLIAIEVWVEGGEVCHSVFWPGGA